MASCSGGAGRYFSTALTSKKIEKETESLQVQGEGVGREAKGGHGNRRIGQLPLFGGASKMDEFGK